MEPDSKEDRFKVVRVVATSAIKTSRTEGSLDLIIQQRRKDNGKFSREFLSVRLNVNNRVMFLHPEVATELDKCLTEILPQVADVQKLLDEEFEKRKKSWDSNKPKQKNRSGGLSNFTDFSKTERSKSKGKRADKIERDQTKSKSGR